MEILNGIRVEREALFEEDSDEGEGEESMSPEKAVDDNGFKFNNGRDHEDDDLHMENFDDRKKSA